MAKTCEVCGQPVRVVSDREGTSHYEAAEDWRRQWATVVEAAEAQKCDIAIINGSWPAYGIPLTWPTILAADEALRAAEEHLSHVVSDLVDAIKERDELRRGIKDVVGYEHAWHNNGRSWRTCPESPCRCAQRALATTRATGGSGSGLSSRNPLGTEGQSGVIGRVDDDG
ncbi:MAG: hypothetical protein V2A73_12430 [Pseudomonadota bacterium]